MGHVWSRTMAEESGVGDGSETLAAYSPSAPILTTTTPFSPLCFFLVPYPHLYLLDKSPLSQPRGPPTGRPTSHPPLALGSEE